MNYLYYDLDLFERHDIDNKHNIKICPYCGAMMHAMGERYDLTVPFEDMWWECFNCGCCLERR